MDIKKGVLLGILIAIIMFSVVSVSAGFWDRLFGGDDDLEGELPTEKAKAFVNVTAPTTPAQIIFVSVPYTY